MLPAHIAKQIVDALHGLATANYLDFCKDPELKKTYRKNLAAGRHLYVSDKVTCGWDDCWSTYKGLITRYPTGPIKQDCEDAACAHAGYLAATCHKGVYVGLVPGKRISHAILGVDQKTPDADNSSSGTNIRVVDPARWYGMPATIYHLIYWKKLC